MFKKPSEVLKAYAKESTLEVRKELGFLKEETTKEPQAFEEKFDIEKHLSYMRLDPKQMGQKGTFEAADVDAVVKALVGDEPAGLQRFKKCISEINKALGKKVGEFGIPSASQEQGASAFTIFSALQLNYLISAIINKQDARVAGKMFEGLAARMVGANASNEDDSIEDMVLEQNKLISLKTIDPSKSEFKGSKYNLAKAIAAKGAVTYLVCEKDKRNDPFSFKAYSFTINRENYFNFISGKGGGETISQEEFESLKNSIVISKSSTATNPANENKNYLNEGVSREQEFFNYTIAKYAIENLGVPQEAADENATEDVKKQLIIAVRDHLKKVFNNTFETEQYKKFSEDEKINNDLLKGIKKIEESIPNSIGKKILNRNEFESALSSVRNLVNITLSDKQIQYYFADYAKKNNLRNPMQAFQQFIQTLQPLLSVLEEIERIYKEESIARKKAAIEAGKQYAATYKTSGGIRPLVEKFFDDLARPDVYQQKTGEGKGTQFILAAGSVKNIAISVGADFDEGYEAFIVSSDMIMTNAFKNNDALKNWIEPIYKQFYSIDTNLKKFYIKDEPGALGEAEKSTEALKKQIQDMPKAESGDYKSAKQLKENKQKDLTNPVLMDIFETLRK